MGVSRDRFYHYQEFVKIDGLEGLIKFQISGIVLTKLQRRLLSVMPLTAQFAAGTARAMSYASVVYWFQAALSAPSGFATSLIISRVAPNE
jgi:hypothetical protein